MCRRTHQSLASVGVAALVRLVTSAGSQMSSSMWQEAVDMLAQAASDTIPQVAEIVTPAPRSHNPNSAYLDCRTCPHALEAVTDADLLRQGYLPAGNVRIVSTVLYCT